MSILETTEHFDNNLEELAAKNLIEKLFGTNDVHSAPSMEIQAQEISEIFLEIPELQYDNWKELNAEERLDILQKFEVEVSQIECRDTSKIKSENLGLSCLGQCSPTGEISINEYLLKSDSRGAYRQTLETYFHEGRHAYQFYNLYVEQVESNSVLIESWHINYNVLGYNPGDSGLFGYEEYYTQPVEMDANVFAEAVMDKLDLR